MTAWDDDVDRATDAAEDAVAEEDFLKQHHTTDQIAEWYARRYGVTPAEAMYAAELNAVRDEPHRPTQAEREDIFRNVLPECDHTDGHSLIVICERCGHYVRRLD